MSSLKAVAINQSSHLHYNDHLVPIADVMGIPLLLIEDDSYDITKKFYPDASLEKIPFADFTPEYLIQNYDVLFMSDLWDREVFHAKFDFLESKYKKTMRNVHAPHGFSDKGFYLRKAANEDITLVYGQNMMDLFKAENVLQNLNQYVMVGNYRYTYYKKHQEFFNSLVLKEVIHRFPKKQKVILYAPTWLDLEESTTFFDAYDQVIGKLPESFNLIVKLHPQLELDDTALYYQIIGKYKNKPNIQFLTDFPLVYPLLYYTDVYLGDMSSIGYDFLIFNRPMFFLNKFERNPKTDRRLLLANAGVSLSPKDYENLYPMIEANLEKESDSLKAIRKELYHYTFGEEKPYSQIKEEIWAACKTTNAS